MFDLLFIAFAVLYFWFGSKVDEWATISTLGFALDTPEGYLRSPRNYHRIRITLLVVACLCLIFTSRIPAYAGLASLVTAWFGTTWLGQRRAFNTYRQKCSEGIDASEDELSRQFFEAESKKSDAKIREFFHKIEKNRI